MTGVPYRRTQGQQTFLGYPTPASEEGSALRRSLMSLEPSIGEQTYPGLELPATLPGLVIWWRFHDWEVHSQDQNVIGHQDWWPDYPDRLHDGIKGVGGLNIFYTPPVIGGVYAPDLMMLSWEAANTLEGTFRSLVEITHPDLDTIDYTIAWYGAGPGPLNFNNRYPMFGNSPYGGYSGCNVEALQDLADSETHYIFNGVTEVSSLQDWDHTARHVWVMTRDAAGSRIYIDGQNWSLPYAGGGPGGPTPGARYVLGGSSDRGPVAGGDMGEFLFYNPSLSSANRQALEGYLSNKYSQLLYGADP